MAVYTTSQTVGPNPKVVGNTLGGAPPAAGTGAVSTNPVGTPTAVPAAAGAFNVAQHLASLNPAQAQAFNAWVGAHVSAGTPGATGAPSTAGHGLQLPAPNEAEFLGDRNAINEDFNGQIADNVNQLALTRVGYNQQSQDMARQQLMDRNNEPDSFVARGMLGSGLEHRALSDLLVTQGLQTSRLAGSRAAAVNALQTAHQHLNNARTIALANNRAKHQAALTAYAEKSVH